MAIINSIYNDFLSMFLSRINIIDFRLSGVINLTHKKEVTFILQFSKYILLLQFYTVFIFCTFKVNLIPFGHYFPRTEHMAFLTSCSLEEINFFFKLNIFHITA